MFKRKNFIYIFFKREKKHDDVPTDHENMPVRCVHKIVEKCDVKISE